MIISHWILLRMRNVADKTWGESQNTHFMFSSFFPQKWCCLWDDVKRYGWGRQVAGGNIIQCMRYACWMTTKAASAFSEYVILITFPWQNWLCQHITVFCCMYIVLLNIIFRTHHIQTLWWHMQEDMKIICSVLFSPLWIIWNLKHTKFLKRILWNIMSTSVPYTVPFWTGYRMNKRIPKSCKWHWISFTVDIHLHYSCICRSIWHMMGSSDS